MIDRFWWHDLLTWLLVLGVALGVGWAVVNSKVPKPPSFEPSSILDGYLTIQNNTLLPTCYLPFIGEVRGDMVTSADIAECESDDDPTAKNPNSTAYGRCQFIDSTWAYVQKKWGITLDRDDPDDQMYACTRLLAEEGTKHWIESKHCWSNLSLTKK